MNFKHYLALLALLFVVTIAIAAPLTVIEQQALLAIGDMGEDNVIEPDAVYDDSGRATLIVGYTEFDEFVCHTGWSNCANPHPASWPATVTTKCNRALNGLAFKDPPLIRFHRFFWSPPRGIFPGVLTFGNKGTRSQMISLTEFGIDEYHKLKGQ